MPSGWTRYLFEQVLPIPYELVFAPALDAGNLNAKYDVLVFPSGAIPGVEGRGGRGGGRGGFGSPSNLPPEYQGRIGSVTAATTLPQLRQFVESGGTLIAVGSSTNLGYHFGLPITNALVEKLSDGTDVNLPSSKYYVPGSVLEVRVDNTHPAAFGLPERVDVFFDNNPVFRLLPDATLKGIRPLAWFYGPEPLRSGWAWGQYYLNGGVAGLEATIGKGKLYLFGPEITFRAQPHGAFKFLFNSLYLAGATEVRLEAAQPKKAKPR
jgi:hypothetical protein